MTERLVGPDWLHQGISKGFGSDWVWICTCGETGPARSQDEARRLGDAHLAEGNA